jgi:hypothetical protein
MCFSNSQFDWLSKNKLIIVTRNTVEIIGADNLSVFWENEKLKFTQSLLKKTWCEFYRRFFIIHIFFIIFFIRNQLLNKILTIRPGQGRLRSSRAPGSLLFGPSWTCKRVKNKRLTALQAKFLGKMAR